MLFAIRIAYFAGFVAIFLLGARAFGIEVPFVLGLASVPVILMAGALPITAALDQPLHPQVRRGAQQGLDGPPVREIVDRFRHPPAGRSPPHFESSSAALEMEARYPPGRNRNETTLDEQLVLRREELGESAVDQQHRAVLRGDIAPAADGRQGSQAENPNGVRSRGEDPQRGCGLCEAEPLKRPRLPFHLPGDVASSDGLEERGDALRIRRGTPPPTTARSD